jgi:hypothetical protein
MVKKNITVQKKMDYYAAKNRISPSESRGQRSTQVPPGPEHMSIQWSHEKYQSGAGEQGYALLGL